MDNLIEIIVAFFIVYSIINTILSSRKSRDRQRTFPQDESEDLKSSHSPADIETLEDLFGIKLPRTDEGYSKQRSDKTASKDSFSWNPEEEFKDKIKQRENLEYRGIQKDIPNVDYDKIPSYEIAAVRRVDKQDVKVYEDDKIKNQRLIEIRNKLLNRTTVRDLFIIVEILNKPKALRK